ncbi:MAG: hypothetical protein ACYDB2_09870 [Acidimicrobiales bacterium]
MSDDRQLKLMARADELKSDLLSTSTTTAGTAPATDAVARADVEPALATQRLTLDQMWGLE